MTTIIAISLGKALGNFIKVDEGNGATTTFRSYLRLLVELNVTKPLKPGFAFRKDGGEPLQVLLKYERLDIYCISCGKIGHKSDHCMAASEEKFPDRYIVLFESEYLLQHSTFHLLLHKQPCHYHP
jgi:hypothetical protein